MISQNSNNKPSGSTAVQCDAGIPIMGRTADTGVYEILKVNADGSLPITTSPPTMLTFPDLITPQAAALAPVGAFAANIIMGYNAFTVTVATAGIYILRPFFMFQYTVLGAVNMYLIKNGSPLDTYVLTRGVGVDSFAPSITDVANGLSAVFHNITNQQIGGTIAKTQFNNNQQFEFYLETGDYKLLITSHTAPTTGSATVYQGFETFAPKF